MNIPSDIICALATPNGMGAIALIRISGPGSRKLLKEVFSKDIQYVESHSLHFGYLKNKKGILIDEVLLSVFDEGKSFTGEESVEITCHGSTYIQQQILETLLLEGGRLAEPGEFTKRAFLNGKMDLSQAEAVADLIASQSQQAHQVALQQLRGYFSSELKELRQQLMNFASLVELELDFSEEDVEFADRTQLKQLVEEVLSVLHRLASSFALGNALKNGVPVALVGAPNTGKSTLLNQLLGEDRAIVSDIAGTTRDVIEETLNIDGILFRLIDTAGIRETEETIESIGIARSHQKIALASIVLCMADASSPAQLDEVNTWTQTLREQFPQKHILSIANKIDLSTKESTCDLAISAKSGLGITALKDKLVQLINNGFDSSQETIIVNVRHHDALLKTISALEKAKEGIITQVSGDFIAMDIRQAMFHLGSITGDISSDDLLGNIFSKFCIGK
jgi:tRNA modification GTPase